MKVLKIDASANVNGNSRVLTDYLVSQLGGDLTVRDVAMEPIPVMSAETLIGFYNYVAHSDVSDDVAHHIALSEKLIAELKAADIVVLGVPMYNFGVPTHLKSWIDHVARRGITFKYGEKGPEGLIGNKRVYVVATSGGTPIGSPANHSSTHVRQVFGFLGAAEVEVIDAGGSKGSPEAIIASGYDHIDALLKTAQSA